jgi:basic membrane protein A
VAWSLYLTRNPIPKTTSQFVTVGVIFNGSKYDGGWNEAQYRGFESIKDDVNVRFVYVENVQPDEAEIVPVMRELIQRNHATIIFGPSYDYGPAILKVAKEYPQVKFFYMGNWKTADNVATCFGRIYQQRYLTGIVAGLQTKTNHIGYVASYPLPEIYRGINAFALGVRSVNPQAVIHVKWSGTWNDGDVETAATTAMLDVYPIDVMTHHQNTVYPLQVAQRRHVYAIGYNIDRSQEFPDIFLTAPVWNWGAFFKERINECLEGRFQAKAYFESIGHVSAIAPLSPLVRPDARAKVAEAEKRLSTTNWDVFYGPIYDQQGNLRVREGENISDAELVQHFDWFVQGVEEMGPRPALNQ